MGRTIATALAFLAGFAIILGVVFSAESFFPGIWLPCALTAIFYGLLGLAPKLGSVRWLYASCVGLGVVLLWLWTRDAKRTANAVHTAEVLAAVVGVTLMGWVATAGVEKKKLPVILMGLLMVCFWLVAYFSSGRGGSDHMVIWVQRFLHLTAESADVLTFWLRKIIHFLFYGMVGIVSLAIGRRGGSAIPALFGLLISLSLASFDEYRQGYFDNRTASAYDIGLDMAGAGAMILVGLAAEKKKVSSRA